MRERDMQAWAAALRQSKRWTEEQARAVFALQGSSGLCLKGFAHHCGFSPSRLYSWQERLRRRSTSSAEVSTAMVVPSFVPVTVRHDAPPRSAGSPALVVRLSDEVQVEVYETGVTTALWVAQLVAECRAGESS